MEDTVGNEEETDHDVNASDILKVSHAPPEVATIPLTECPLSDAIFKELSIINGQINSLKRKDLVAKLKKYHLNHKGDIRVLQKRLKNHFRVTKLTNAKLMEKQILQPYYVIIDFEATCQENNPVDYKYEIIEFPAILVHTETLRIVDVFHSYVKPVIHPKLTAFCVQLTGISQEDVDSAPTFREVLRKFESWLNSHGLLSSKKIIVTDGPWDMGRFLYLQCKLSKIPYPLYAKEWINVRRIFRNFYKYHQGGSLEDMVKFAGLKFEGRAHSGLDDSYNIARMFIHLLSDGAIIRTNERITQHCRSHDEVGSKGRRERPKSACSIHQEGEGKVSRLYSLTRGQCRAVTRCNSALGLRRHEGRISRSPCPLQDLNEAETEKKYNIVNFKRSLKLLGFDPEEFGIESSTSTQKPRTKNVKPLTITRLERRTVSLDDVKKAVLNEFENDLRFPDNSHRQMLAKAVYEEWYFKKRDEALKRREQSVKQSKIRQWEREHDKNEAKKKSQETYEEWLQKKKVQQRMEKIKASSVMNSLNKRQSHQEKSELAFHTWKKEKEIALQKKLEDKKKEKQSQEEEEKERKRIEAEKAYNLWKRKTEEDMRRRKQQRERKQKEKKIYEALQVEERHRNAESSFRCWRQKKEQDMKEQMKRARRAKELSLETRVRMRDNQLYESNQAFMEWLDMIEERLQLQHLLDEKHKSKHPPWFPAGVGRPSSLRN